MSAVPPEGRLRVRTLRRAPAVLRPPRLWSQERPLLQTQAGAESPLRRLPAVPQLWPGQGSRLRLRSLPRGTFAFDFYFLQRCDYHDVSGSLSLLQAPRAPKQPAPAGPGSCNPLYEEGCNPLSATRFATPPHSYKNDEADEAAAIRAAPSAAEQNNDPYAMFRDAYAQANRGADPYAMYRQAPASAPVSPPAAPQANDPYALLRRYMAQAQQNDPRSPRMEAAPESNPNDPFTAIREAAAAMHRRGPSNPRQQIPFSNPSYEEPAREEHHPLGPPGKTKEGYECFIGYDHDCFPVKPTEPRSGVHRHMPYPAEAYEPHLNADGTRSGVMEPSNPDCDPEYDRDCRLRRYEPEQPQVEAQPEHHAEEDYSQGAAEREHQPEEHEEEQYEAEPYQSGQEEPHMSYPQMSYPQMSYPQMSQGIPSLQDILRLYGDQSPEQDERRAYAGDYRQK